MKKRIMCIVLAAVMVLAGCSSKQDGESSSAPAEKGSVKLEIWTDSAQQELVVELCGSFAREHPENNYSFTLNTVTAAEAADLALTEGCSADVLCITTSELPQLAAAGLLLSTDADRQWIALNSTAAALSASQHGGNIFGYPYAAETQLMYYDRSLLTEDEVSRMESILAKDIEGVSANLAMNLLDGRQQAAFFMAAGCSMPGEDSVPQSRISGDSGMLAGEYLVGFVKSPALDAQCDSAEIRTGFAEGSIAAAVAGTEVVPQISASLGEDMGVSPLPLITLPDGRCVQTGGAAQYSIAAVSASSQYAEQAMLFARALAGEEAQRYRLEKLSVFPVNSALLRDEELLAGYPVLTALREQLHYSRVIEDEGFFKCAPDFGEELISGGVTLNNLRDKLSRFAELVFAA